MIMNSFGPAEDDRDATHRLHPATVIDEASDERDTQSIKIINEELEIGKRIVADGTVRLSVRSDFVDEVAEYTLDQTVIEIDRVPIDQPVEFAPPVRTQGDVTIIPVVQERLVMVKQLVLVEEIHVHKRRQTESVREPVQLRKQSVTVERVEAKPQSPSTPVSKD